MLFLVKQKGIPSVALKMKKVTLAFLHDTEHTGMGEKNKHIETLKNE